MIYSNILLNIKNNPAERSCFRLRMKSLYILSFLFFSVFNLYSSDILTESERDWLEYNIESLPLWFNPDFPPFEFSDHSGSFTGVGADIFRLIEERLGVSFSKKLCPDWNDHLKGLETGECSIAPVIVRTEEREKYIQFTTPYSEIPVVIIGTDKVGNNLNIKKLESYRVAVVKGYATEDYIRKQPDIKNIFTVESVEKGLQAVAFGQADVFLENLAVASYFISKLGISNLQIAGFTDYKFIFRLGISSKYPVLFSIIQKALSDISEEENNEVYDKWVKLKSDKLSPGIKRLLFSALIFLAILLAGISLLIFGLKKRLKTTSSGLLKETEEKKHIEARFESLFMNAPIPLLEAENSGRVLKINNAFYDATGYSISDIPDIDSWWPLAYPDPVFREKVKRDWELQFSKTSQGEKQIEGGVFRIRCKTGIDRFFIIGASRLDDRYIVSMIDITDRYNIQKEVEKSRDTFFTLFELAPFACVISDYEGHFLMVNQHFCERVGLKRDEIIGKTNIDLNRIVDPAASSVIAGDIRKNGYSPPMEIFINDNGSETYALFSSRVIEWEGQNAILSATVNITEIKQFEKELRVKEENLRVTMNSLKEGVVVTDVAGHIIRVNRAAEEMIGMKEYDASGRKLGSFLFFTDARTKEPVQKVCRSDDFNIHPEGFTDHYIMKENDGKEHHILTSCAPVRNDRDEISGIVIVFHDVSEEQRLQEQLRQSDKMNAIGKLAGGVAHDFNNMLGIIIGYSDLAMEKARNDSELSDYLKQVLDAAHRSSQLTRRLLVFARKQTIAPIILDLNEVIGNILDMLKQLLGENIRVVWKPCEEKAVVNIDPGQVDQVLANLCVNARDAIDDNGEIIIETEKVLLTEEYCSYNSDAVPGDYIMLAVSDNGSGMSRDIISRIFEPFFTTKSNDQGTGIGLSTVFGIVKQNSGFINVYSEPGQGSTFKIFIPRAEKSPSDKGESVSEITEDLLGRETIMVVEDQEILLSTATMILSNSGYKVLPASSSLEAIQIAEENKMKIDMLFSDLVLPEMNGYKLYRHILTYHPGIKKLFTSGYTENAAKFLEDADLKLEFISKPYTKKELLTRIRKLLDS